MLQGIKLFLIFIAFYFILHTLIVYGIFDGRYQALFSVVKEGYWLIMILLIVFLYPKESLLAFAKMKAEWLILFLFLALGLIVTMLVSSSRLLFIKNVIIWLKYGWYFMFIFLSSAFIWYIWSAREILFAANDTIMHKEKNGKKDVNNFFVFLKYFFWFIILFWFIIQWTKILYPDIRSILGFGWLDVYKAWMPPPLYYLTKHDGVMRYSGLFSWPNNFAFWLIAVTPFLIYGSRWYQKILLLFFWVINLGRVIIVAWLTQITILLSKEKRVRKNLFVVWLGLWIIIWLFTYITYLKRESTTEHFRLWLQAFWQFYDRPRGYGLGSSGPGVHRNGSLLPENYYLQLALDYWFLWPCLFFMFWSLILSKIKKTTLKWWSHKLHSYNNLFAQWFIGMLVAGLFLHVFEDSMVNYLFFVPWGILYWYCLCDIVHQPNNSEW